MAPSGVRSRVDKASAWQFNVLRRWGLSSGFAAAGLKPTLRLKSTKNAVATYRADVSDAVMHADIGREAERVTIELERRLGERKVFVAVGGSPCQGFSTASARDHADPRNSLIFSYISIVDKRRLRMVRIQEC